MIEIVMNVSVWNIEISNTFVFVFLTQIEKSFNVQSNFDGSKIFGTIENCSRHGWLEPLRVNYGAKSGSKWR